MRKRWIGLTAVVVTATAWLGFNAEFHQSAVPNSVDDNMSNNNNNLLMPSAVSGLESESIEQKSLLDSAIVQGYLKRQSEKQALQDYFDNPDNDPKEAKNIWSLIEKTEAEGGVLAFEALHLKMAWLEKNNTDRAAFEAASKDLLAHYREKSLLAAEQYNPENTPEFKDYKSQELKIIQEIDSLESIPRGLTREAYLREKLLAARMAAYGQGAKE